MVVVNIVMRNGWRALTGLAFGDTWGSFYEFKPANMVDADWIELEELRTGEHKNVFGLGWGDYTDDTALTLGAMKAFLKADGKWVPHFHEQSIVDYAFHGAFSPNGKCFDIGNATLRAAHYYRNKRGDNVQSLMKSEELTGDFSDSGGNGFLMKILPYAIYSVLNIKTSQQKALFYASASAISHAHKDAMTSALGTALMLEAWLQGDTGVVLQDMVSENMFAPGYCTNSFNIVMTALRKCKPTLEEGIESVIREGHDTDTNAAIYGMFAAIREGNNGITADDITDFDEISELYLEFFDAVSGQ